MPDHCPSIAFHCPVCGAEQHAGSDDTAEQACRRCRADLGAYIQTRRSVALRTIEDIAAIYSGTPRSPKQ